MTVKYKSTKGHKTLDEFQESENGEEENQENNDKRL